MSTLTYWLVFCFAVLLIVAVPLVSAWESRADERDRAVWEKQPGAVR